MSPSLGGLTIGIRKLERPTGWIECPGRRSEGGHPIASDTDVPVVLCIAVYADPGAARGDWETVKRVAKDYLVRVEGLILVSRRANGKIRVDDDFHETRRGAVWGVAWGAVGAAAGAAAMSALYPPLLVAGAAVGAGIGVGVVGGLMPHGRMAEVMPDVDHVLPLDSSGIVAIFEEQWAHDIANALSNASSVTQEKVDATSAERITAAATENQAATTS